MRSSLKEVEIKSAFLQRGKLAGEKGGMVVVQAVLTNIAGFECNTIGFAPLALPEDFAVTISTFEQHSKKGPESTFLYSALLDEKKWGDILLRQESIDITIEKNLSVTIYNLSAKDRVYVKGIWKASKATQKFVISQGKPRLVLHYVDNKLIVDADVELELCSVSAGIMPN